MQERRKVLRAFAGSGARGGGSRCAFGDGLPQALLLKGAPVEAIERVDTMECSFCVALYARSRARRRAPAHHHHVVVVGCGTSFEQTRAPKIPYETVYIRTIGCKRELIIMSGPGTTWAKKQGHLPAAGIRRVLWVTMISSILVASVTN